MIFVNRSNVQRPKWFGSIEWGKAQHALLNHFGAKADVRSQRRTATIAGTWPKEVINAVWSIFSGRCAMCESALLKPSLAAVKRFRPIETEESENRYTHGYAALLWENLILLCPSCDRARGDRFPLNGPPSPANENLRQISFDLSRPLAIRKAYELLEGELAQARAIERPLQIDPTFDVPAEFLTFEDRGRVLPNPAANIAGALRGQHTIEAFQLNRTELIEKRRCASKVVGTALRSVRAPKAVRDARDAATQANLLFPRLSRVTSQLGGEFESAKAFRLMRWLLRWMHAPLNEVLPHLKWPKADLQHAQRVLLPIWNNLAGGTRRQTGKPRRTDVSTASPRHVAAQFSRVRVKKVRLKNFRQFRAASFELPFERPKDAFGLDHELREKILQAGLSKGEHLPEPEAHCGWKTLLGENGVGKSSVLQAIALTLLADQSGDAGPLKELCDLRHSVAHGTTRGSIEVWMEDREQPIRLGFSAKAVRLSGVTKKANAVLYLRGYGTARLLPPKTSDDSRAHDPAPQEVHNLFDPYHPLADPVAWLRGLDDEARHLAFIALKDLLDLPANAQLAFQGWQGVTTLGILRGQHFIPLAYFSAGYQSIVALACDIMAGFGRRVGDMQKQTGVVLLDEIGTNLHPRWRLRIVQALRRTFPLMQFIVSTHEPLCLRGLGEGEVALLTLDNEHAVHLRDDLPSPAIYRVDQLLTGDFFGLQTAYDPDEEAAFDTYHSLLVRERELQSQGKSLSAEHASLLDSLRERLKQRLTLGDTVAERQVLAALEQAEIQQSKKPGRREPLKGSNEAKAAAQRLLRALPGKEGKRTT